MILAINTETSGLIPKDAEIGSSQFPWPVSVAALLFDFDGRDHAVVHTRIRADGRTIGSEAQSVHGISSREAGRSGVPEVVAMSMVCHLAGQARILTGFGVGFDRSIVESAIVRLGQDPKRLVRTGLQVVDLLVPSTPFCKRQREAPDGGYRWPILDEAMAGIRNERGLKSHGALRNCKAAKRLFLSLHAKGALDIENAA